MLSETPGTPGRRVHAPRTIRSICTPACEAAYSARIDLRLVEGVHLGDDACRPAGARMARFALDLLEHAGVQREGRLQQALELDRRRQARQLLEDLVHVAADVRVRR